jgi:ribosomal protein S6--L-glutamate ligase
MKIGILCFRSYDSYEGVEERKLVAAAERMGHEAVCIHVPRVTYALSPDRKLFYEGSPFPSVDVLLSRARVVDQIELRLFVIRFLEEQGVPLVNGYEALLRAKNKLTSTFYLQKAGLAVLPTWVVEDEAEAMSLAKQIGFPIVLKSAYGTFGHAVQKVDDLEALKPMLDFFWNSESTPPLLLQPFVSEAKGKDHRLFVVGNKVVAAMERSAAKGEFRSNVEQGGETGVFIPSGEEVDLAVKATRVLGLDYSGVDIIETSSGPAVLEVNGNPGFKALEEVTGVDVAALLIELAVSRFQIAEPGVRKE